jgi:4'-phosphopantetheinyl transferase
MIIPAKVRSKPDLGPRSELQSGGNDPTVTVFVKTMRVESLDGGAVMPWLDALDGSERERAARFLFACDRIVFIAAHMLMRAVLGQLLGEPPSALRFITGAHGKPVAHLGDRPAPVAFNLSHTKGIVGVAVAARSDWAIGFDLEGASREPPLQIARDQFSEPEVAWLNSLPEPVQAEGFLQLWTLKEAFIKATGAGLSADLKSFWFETCPPKLHLLPLAEHAAARARHWSFAQRVLEGGFIAAVGIGSPNEERLQLCWTSLDPGTLTAEGLLSANRVAGV